MKAKDYLMDTIRANRRGSRDAGLENKTGWVAVRRVHASKKTYKRNNKTEI